MGGWVWQVWVGECGRYGWVGVVGMGGWVWQVWVGGCGRYG